MGLADLESIKRNKLARTLANDILELADGELYNKTDSMDWRLHQRFWELVKKEAESRLKEWGPPIDTQNLMSDDEARKFGETEMPWGKYIGTKVNRVPLDYLLYVTEDKSKFNRQLKQYLESRSLQAEQQEPDWE